MTLNIVRITWTMQIKPRRNESSSFCVEYMVTSYGCTLIIFIFNFFFFTFLLFSCDVLKGALRLGQSIGKNRAKIRWLLSEVRAHVRKSGFYTL